MRLLKIILFLLVLAGTFIGGVILGNVYNVTDFLCPAKSYAHKLESNFVSSDGIFFPKGTIIHVRGCAYMQRFNWQFAIDRDTLLTPYTGQSEYDYGFSELHPMNDIQTK